MTRRYLRAALATCLLGGCISKAEEPPLPPPEAVKAAGKAMVTTHGYIHPEDPPGTRRASRPQPDDLARRRPLAHAARVGFVRLPDDPGVRVGGLLRPGAVFACAAEGLLLALDPRLEVELAPDALIGAIAPETVEALAVAGRRHGLLDAG